ncbi:MAG: ATP-dependent DNA helicase RecG [Candidatus Margulisiibacteriota bacterium]|nr:ATP-dependent DNA helicase RecG [Candidatus Margulisiibacteriota bacterium]
MTTKLDTPAQYIKGVGPKVAKLLKKLGLETAEDIIYFFPRDYDDRSTVKAIAQLSPSAHEVVKGEIISINNQQTRGRFSVLKIVVSDRSGSVQAVWFNQPYLARMFRKGMRLILSGKVEISNYEGIMQFIVKDFEIDTGVNPKIVPFYPLTEGLYPKKMRAIVERALDECLDEIEDTVPEEVKKKYKLPDLQKSIHQLHFPDDLKKIAIAHRRLAFDDFYNFFIELGRRRKKIKAEKGVKFKVDEARIREFKNSLPFKLTGSQERVLNDIFTDMQSDRPMNRLLQGDVGSGKTIVAAIAALAAVNDGYQVAFMAPTEILAQQHYAKIANYLDEFKVSVELVTSNTLGKGREQKADIIIGTHALIQEKVKYKNLGLVIIDEQHRFGVMQRKTLAQKGMSPGLLIMTATPIPRSLALTLYGDLDRSVIGEMPPGRTPIKTHYVPEGKRSGAYSFMREKVKEGRQIFIICPLVEESEKVDLKAAMDEAERLQNDIFPDLKVGLIHGRLPGDEKDRIMKDFKNKKIDILVSTTVIEVGIDIPNATVMVIEHAERFGLSQLHQLRGRIGRGSEQSFCFLIGQPKTEDARIRIRAMLDSNDGFDIAEVDLKLRGPGDFFGTKQSGLPEFKVADIIRDAQVLREARQAVIDQGKL